jgi:hypothetical protein
VSALLLVDRLGSRLGPYQARAHLMKPFLALFESQRPDVYRQLLRQGMLDQVGARPLAGVEAHVRCASCWAAWACRRS